MKSDFEELNAFARRRDEEAFARVVRRYADFVYSTCLRQVKDPGLAEDAAQAVFVLLAERAGKVSSKVRLVGWLFNAARYASNNVMRSERRRKRHEKEAPVRMVDATSDANLQHQELEEVLDQAMARLRESDRDALLLRFFRGQSHDEIAVSLGLSGHAAKMRVLRAIERLRAELARDGITMMPSVLEMGLLAMTTGSAKAAPVGFAAAATKAAMVGGSALARSAAKAMLMAKLKVAAVVMIGLVVVSGTATTAVLLAQQNAQAKANSAVLESPATKPARREKFDSVYHLDSGETVKWIRPPFIRERGDYYRAAYPDRAKTNPQPPMRWLLYWDGNGIDPKRYVYGTGGVLSVRDLLDQIAELTPEQYLAPRKLLDQSAEGDWMIRSGVTVEEKLNGLQKVLGQRGMKFNVERRTMDREVIVAGGTFYLPEESGNGDIQLIVGEANAASGRTRFLGSTRASLQAMGIALGRPVIGEWKGLGKRHVNISIEKDLNLETMPKAQADQKLAGILKNLAEQSGLEFKLETRTIDTWVLSQAPATPATQALVDPPWRKGFDRVYTLAPGEDIRRIPLPFIPERQKFIDEKIHFDGANGNGVIGGSSDPSGRGSMILEFDPATGRVDQWRRINLTPWPMGNLLSHLSGIPMASFVITDGLGGTVPGDWIWRKGATPEQKLEGYRKAMEGTRQAFAWEKKMLKRDVIVAHGTFAPDEWPERKVVVSIDPEGKTEANHGGDVGYFFRELAKMTGRPVINEWKGSDVLRVEFDEPALELGGLSKEKKEEKLASILKRLGDQLHIEMMLQTRDVESYVVSPATKGK